ncbi:hypothetical protein GCM10010431_00740 [Streptomyces kunmingensis]
MIDVDPGAGGLAREEAGGGPQKISGIHQDDAAVHAIHPLSPTYDSPDALTGRRPRIRFGFPSSLPDRAGVNGPNSIFGVADAVNAGGVRPYPPCYTR